MAITNYSELVDAITDRMNDSALSTYAPEFIGLAEAQFNRRLNTLEGEATATTTAASSIALPTGFLAIKSIYLDTDPKQVLNPMSAKNVATYWASQTTAKPLNYAVASNEIMLAPSPDDTYTVKMTYLAKLTPLSATNTTNWLLESHPDLYLYASLAHAEFRGWNDGRLPLINSAVEQIIDEINKAEQRKRTSVGMRMRATVIE